MSRRAEWRKILDSEAVRWSAISSEQLIAELAEISVYGVAHEGKNFQVEVELVENSDKYIHVIIGVDDGSLPASIFPVSTSIIRQKLVLG